MCTYVDNNKQMNWLSTIYVFLLLKLNYLWSNNKYQLLENTIFLSLKCPIVLILIASELIHEYKSNSNGSQTWRHARLTSDVLGVWCHAHIKCSLSTFKYFIFYAFGKCVCVLMTPLLQPPNLDLPAVLHVPSDPTHAQLPQQAVSTHTYTDPHRHRHIHAHTELPSTRPPVAWASAVDRMLLDVHRNTHTHTLCAWTLITLLHTEIIHRRPTRKTNSAETTSSSFRPLSLQRILTKSEALHSSEDTESLESFSSYFWYSSVFGSVSAYGGVISILL